jgi:actin related protein 2/3 complex, subunit 2
VVSDFDGVTFHISTPESKTKILVSISVKCYQELVKYGARGVLEREYGPYIVPAEQGFDFSVQVDLDNLPGDQGWCVHLSVIRLLTYCASRRTR